MLTISNSACSSTQGFPKETAEDASERQSSGCVAVVGDTVLIASASQVRGLHFKRRASEPQEYLPEGLDRGRSSKLDGQLFTASGHAVKFVDKTFEEKYKCMLCGLLLHNPVQTERGHRFCLSCIDPVKSEICSLDKKPFGKFFADNACQREIDSLLVQCHHSNLGCDWIGKLNSLEAHSVQCDWQKVKCSNENCVELLFRKELKKHVEFHCDYRPVKCPSCDDDVPQCMMQSHQRDDCLDVEVKCPLSCTAIVSRKELNDHLALACPESILPCLFGHLGCTFQGKRSALDIHINSKEDNHLILVVEAISKNQCEAESLREVMSIKEEQIRRLEQQIQILESIHKTALAGKKAKVFAVEEALSKMLTKSSSNCSPNDSQVHDVQANVTKITKDVKDADKTLDEVRRAITVSAKEITLAQSILKEHDHRLDVRQSTAYNGRLLWLVDWASVNNDARAGGKTSVYSRPFYSSHHGYKMCARLYPLGDGVGRGSHVSLFFTILRGQDDAILKWPFQQRVTLSLLDQSHRRHHIRETFLPDGSSSSYQRPTSAMNIASGCPRFVSHALIESRFSDYVKDGKICFAVSIDLAGLEN